MVCILLIIGFYSILAHYFLIGKKIAYTICGGGNLS